MYNNSIVLNISLLSFELLRKTIKYSAIASIARDKLKFFRRFEHLVHGALVADLWLCGYGSCLDTYSRLDTVSSISGGTPWVMTGLVANTEFQRGAICAM